MFYGLDLATEEKKILILIFLIWVLFDTWFSEYIKYLIGYSFKKKCVGTIVGFKKIPEECRNILGPNYYSAIEYNGKKYLKKRSFFDKLNQKIIFVEGKKDKRIFSSNEELIYEAAYDTKYVIPYVNLGQIVLSVITLYLLWKV